MRKKPGYRELSFRLTEEQYAALERYWRYYTKDQYITNAALTLLMQAIQERLSQQSEIPR